MILIIILVVVASLMVQLRFKNRFKKYSEIALSSGLSGHDVAERMLKDYGVYNVKIVAAEGQLSDHYNPATYTVNLSPDVYHGRSVAAAAVAAHECGHAVQHAKAYAWLGLRTALVPVVNVAAGLMQYMFLLAFLAYSSLGIVPLYIAFGATAIITTFSFITLPVEFDASNRALAWLNNNYSVMRSQEEHTQAKDALWWAAMTYVVAALGSLAQLLYLAMILFGGRRR